MMTLAKMCRFAEMMELAHKKLRQECDDTAYPEALAKLHYMELEMLRRLRAEPGYRRVPNYELFEERYAQLVELVEAKA